MVAAVRSDACLGSRDGALTSPIQKENYEHNRGSAHKEDRENDEGGEHLPDVIEA